jgi:hypothetical protein
VERIYAACLRHAGRERAPVQKAVELPGRVIAQIIDRLFMESNKLTDIAISDIRTGCLATLQFYSCGRAADCLQLRAGDVRMTELNNETALAFTFRGQKNDQYHNGNIFYLVREQGRCPVDLFLCYFERMGLKMAQSEVFDNSFLFPLARSIKIGARRVQVSDGRKAISSANYIRDLRRLCAKEGWTAKVSTKSPKMAGTSAAFAAGLSDGEVRDKGRWKSHSTALHYRIQTSTYCHQIATATSIFTNTARVSQHSGASPRQAILQQVPLLDPARPRTLQEFRWGMMDVSHQYIDDEIWTE